MDVQALGNAIENFNERNDSFAIGMNFAVAGIGSLQELIKLVQSGKVTAKDVALLDNADQLIAFGLEQMRTATKDKAVLGFLERYRGFIAELKKIATR